MAVNYKFLALLLSSSLFHSQAWPIKREANVETERRHLEEINCALHLLKDIQRRYHSSLGHKTLCYMYNQYIEYTKLFSQSGPLVDDTQYRQNLKWKGLSLNNTCKWVQLRDESIAPKG